MAYKIPDSPNIIGGQAVVREPAGLQGTTVTPDFHSDIKAPAEAFAKIAGAYAEHVDSQNRVLMTEVQNHYLKRMSDEVNEIKRTHKLRDAADLYPLMRQASDKIVADLTGAAKDDGQLRIANKQFKEQFVQWVAEQQPTYISNAATYGASEWQKYAQIQGEENDAALAKQILEADSEITIQNAIRGFMQNAQTMNPGSDPRRIAAYAAAKVDSAVSARLLKDIPNDPLGVIALLDSNKTVDESLSSESKKVLYDEAVKSFEGMASKFLAEAIATNGASGSEGLIAPEVMMRVYKTDNEFIIDSKRRAIEAEAKTMADANKKESMGVRANALSRATNAYYLATNDQEREAAAEQLAKIDPATSALVKRTKNQKEQLLVDMATIQKYGREDLLDKRRAAFAVPQLRTRIEERLQPAVDSMRAKRGESSDAVVTPNESYLRSVSKSIGTKEWSQLSEERLLEINERLPEGYKLTDSELKEITGVSYKGLTTMMGMSAEDVASYDRVRKDFDTRKNAIPKYIELSRRQATGEQIALDASVLDGMPPDYIYQLNQQALVMSEFYRRSDEIRNAYGIDLRSKIQTLVPEFKNYSIPSQNAFIRNVIQAIPSGQMPGDTQLESIIRSAANAAIVPEDSALRGVLLNHGVLEQQNIDPMLSPREARDALDEAGATSAYDAAFTTVSKARTYKKTTDKSYEKSRGKAESILDDYANVLPPASSWIVENFKEDLIDIVMAGEWVLLSTIVNIQGAN